MEQIQNEQTLENTQAVETEIKEVGESKQEVSLGKFKDVNALMNAYNSLQSEFTKRCQKIKELEATTTELNKVVEESLSQEKRDEIIKDYLKEILSLSDNNSSSDTAPTAFLIVV